MRITYDPEADRLHIELCPKIPRRSRDLGTGVAAELDEQDRVIGLEVLEAREYQTSSELRLHILAVGGAESYAESP